VEHDVVADFTAADLAAAVGTYPVQHVVRTGGLTLTAADALSNPALIVGRDAAMAGGTIGAISRIEPTADGGASAVIAGPTGEETVPFDELAHRGAFGDLGFVLPAAVRDGLITPAEGSAVLSAHVAANPDELRSRVLRAYVPGSANAAGDPAAVPPSAGWSAAADGTFTGPEDGPVRDGWIVTAVNQGAGGEPTFDLARTTDGNGYVPNLEQVSIADGHATETRAGVPLNELLSLNRARLEGYQQQLPETTYAYTDGGQSFDTRNPPGGQATRQKLAAEAAMEYRYAQSGIPQRMPGGGVDWYTVPVTVTPSHSYIGADGASVAMPVASNLSDAEAAAVAADGAAAQGIFATPSAVTQFTIQEKIAATARSGGRLLYGDSLAKVSPGSGSGMAVSVYQARYLAEALTEAVRNPRNADTALNNWAAWARNFSLGFMQTKDQTGVDDPAVAMANARAMAAAARQPAPSLTSTQLRDYVDATERYIAAGAQTGQLSTADAAALRASTSAIQLRATSGQLTQQDVDVVTGGLSFYQYSGI
jgi:hypothetical protein